MPVVDDMLPVSTPGTATAAQIRMILEAATEQGMNEARLCARLNVSGLSDLTEARAARVLKRLREMSGLAEGQEAS